MVSGDIVNTTVTFVGRGSMVESFTISINNDSVGLENDEEFEIQFTQSVPSDGVMFGPNSNVIISDDDSECIIIATRIIIVPIYMM